MRFRDLVEETILHRGAKVDDKGSAITLSLSLYRHERGRLVRQIRQIASNLKEVSLQPFVWRYLACLADPEFVWIRAIRVYSNDLPFGNLAL